MMRAVWIGALALALAAPVAAQDAPVWRPVDSETGKIRDVEGLEALAEAFPDSGSVRLRMLQPLLEAGEIERLLDVLKWLKDRGYVFGEVPQTQIPKLVGEKHAEAARASLIPQAEIIEASEVVATVPAEAGLIESVNSPDAKGIFLATSITRNSVYTLNPLQDWQEAAFPGANDLSGLLRVPVGNMGWLASSNLDGSEDDFPLFSGLIGISARGDITRIPAPEGVSISDLSSAPDGTIYASDPVNGGIYHKPPDGETLEVLIGPGTFRSPQGSAVSEDGTKLYVSDYRYGLGFVDFATGKVSRLASDVPVILDGTDGLWLHDRELVVVQNGTSPMRISAFTLSEDGTRITAARVLEQAHSAWTEPLGGSIADDALIYVATGQWDRYEKGKLREGMEAIPTEIRRLPLK